MKYIYGLNKSGRSIVKYLDSIKESYVCWDDNKDKWAIIREVWDDVYTSGEDLSLKQEVDGVRLYQELFGLEKNIKKSKVVKSLRPYVK